jgi:hypothetical protein
LEGDTALAWILWLFGWSAEIGFIGCWFGTIFAWDAYYDQKKLLRAAVYQVENYSLLERFEEANLAASLLAITSHKQTTAMVIGVITLIGMLNFASELYPTWADYFATKYG